jgi:predicted TIM-barrel fold metal-dependent hydrolase
MHSSRPYPLTILLVAFSTAFLLGSSPVLNAQQSPPARPPIIDVHAHANNMFYLPDGRPLPRPCINLNLDCQNKPSAFTTDEALRRGTVEYMRRFNIVLAVLSGRDSGVVARWVDSTPGRFMAGWMINGEPTGPSIARLKRAFQSGQLAVLGEVNAQYYSRPPDDPVLEPYFNLAEALDVPVLIHTAGIGARNPKFRSAFGHPLLLEKVLTRHPRLRIYLENAGYPFAEEMVALMFQYPQVYADLSTITWVIPRAAFHEYLRTLVRAGFGQRLMFGSDQVIWPETIEDAVASIETADFLTPDQKRDIFFNNAVRFFRLRADTLKVWPESGR